MVFISDQRFFALKRTAVLMLVTWNMQLATVLSKDGFMVWDEGPRTALFTTTTFDVFFGPATCN